MSILRWSVLTICCLSGLSQLDGRSTYLVIDDTLLSAIREKLPAGFEVIPKSRLDPAALLASVAGGNSLIWIGEGSQLPGDLWIGTFRPVSTPLQVTVAAASPVMLAKMAFNHSMLSSAFIKPLKEMPYHNVDEEPRADLLPILEARDRFGQIVGYPGVLMRYYAPSLVRHRFAYSECFLFLFDRPAEALPGENWITLLNGISAHLRSGLQLSRVTTSYASYRTGERVQITARIHNVLSRAVSADLRFYAKAPRATQFQAFGRQRRISEAEDDSEAVADFVPRGRPGLWTVRVEVRQDLAHARELALEGRPIPVDRRDIGVVVLDGMVATPAIVRLNGPRILLDGTPGFWAGTNYYPSSSWWEWLWRDFRPLDAGQDFASMRRTGYRLVRVWVDPILDEQTLRAMDAAIYLAAQSGIVLDICIFTQWVRTLGFERKTGEHVRFDFRGSRDFNVYGISFRNLALQREYVKVLARRWRNAGNLIYNLSNETYVKDPDPSQMDRKAVNWKGIPKDSGITRDSLLFQRWADVITGAIRQVGGRQPIIPGYLFSEMGGGDSYLAQRHGEIAAWHSYSNPEHTAASLSFMDTACSGRPVLLEEFGTQGWNRPGYYDGAAHAALASGAAGAMSYEWGVRWLAPEQSFYAVPLRDILAQDPDPRWFAPVADLVKKWPATAPGIHPAPSGFFYGSIYSGTPFPAEAAIALGRLGLMGKDLSRTSGSESTYVVIPSAAPPKTITEVIELIQYLRRDKVRFGVLQEDCLTRLPKSARVLIWPAASPQQLTRFRRTGVQTYTNEQQWKTSPDLVRVSVEPGAGIDVLTRPTVSGTLYSLLSSNAPGPIKLALTRNIVRLGLSGYGLVEERKTGIGLIEASGDVVINGAPFCIIERGRAIIAAEEGQGLESCTRARILATEPARIYFARPIGRAVVRVEGVAEPIATWVPKGSVIDIDPELARYVIEIDFHLHTRPTSMRTQALEVR